MSNDVPVPVLSGSNVDLNARLTALETTVAAITGATQADVAGAQADYVWTGQLQDALVALTARVKALEDSAVTNG